MKKKLISALLGLSIASALVAPAASAKPTNPANPLEQTVESSEEISTEFAELTTGHIDLGPKVVNGEWKLLARDDNPTPPVWRDPANLVLRVSDAGKLQVPDTDDYKFIPVEGDNREAYVVPQTQMESVIWLGWSTQDPGVVAELNRGGSLTLRGVDGPGKFLVFLQGGFEKPMELWNSTKAYPQEFWVDSNTHTHANWIFTKPGVYRLHIAFTGDKKDGGKVDLPATLTFAVGDSTKIEDATAAPSASAQPAEQNQSAKPAEQAAPAKDPVNDKLIWIIVGGVAVVVIIIVIVASVMTKRAKENA